MYGKADLIWLLPLFLAGVGLLVSCWQWWRVANGKNEGVDLKPTAIDFREAARATAITLGLLGSSILAAFMVRF